MVDSPSEHIPTDRTETASDRLQAALDLMEVGIELMRENIKRRNPHLNPEEVLAELQAWLEKPDEGVVVKAL